MAKENVLRFKEKLEADEKLSRSVWESVTGLGEGEAAVKIASAATEMGLPFTAEEFHAYMAEAAKLTDEDLDKVAGGTDAECNEIVTWMYISGKARQEPIECGFCVSWHEWELQAFVESAIRGVTGMTGATARCHFKGILGSGDVENTYNYVDKSGNTVNLTHRQAMNMVKKFYPAT